jgi:hypothetical protein
MFLRGAILSQTQRPAIGDLIRHPKFGSGKLLEIGLGVARLEFPDGTTRLFTPSFVGRLVMAESVRTWNLERAETKARIAKEAKAAVVAQQNRDAAQRRVNKKGEPITLPKQCTVCGTRLETEEYREHMQALHPFRGWGNKGRSRRRGYTRLVQGGKCNGK